MRFNSITIITVLSIVLMSFSISSAGGAEMVEVPGGEFKSSPDLKVVKVDSFAIDKYEVTNAQWKEFSKDFDVPAGKENHPVTEVSYFEAAEYCKSQGKRIPTALEWEKAARGVDGRLYPWGSEFDKGKANTMESGAGGTTPVGSFAAGASPYGAMDMTGNVWEWVDGWADESKKQYRVTMGGSFFDDKDNGRVFSTLKSIPDDIHTFIGFRCAR